MVSLTKTTNLFSISILALSSILLSANSPTYAQTASKPTLQHVATGHDPFDRVQANSTHDFVWHLRNSSALRSRYARHFGIPESRVINFIQNSLVPYTLPSPKKMTTFGVAKNGMIYPVKVNLAKGTKVWATREGVPVLKWTCSNPLVYKLPGEDLIPAQYARVPRHTKPTLTKSLSIAYPEELVAEEHAAIARNKPEDDVLNELAFREPLTGTLVAAVSDREGNGIDEVPLILPDANPIAAAPPAKPGRPHTSGVEILLPLILGSGSSLLPVQGSGNANASAGGGIGSGESSPLAPPTPASVPESTSAVLVTIGSLFGTSLLVISRKRKA